MRHVISWSGGKDSTASVILMHEHEEEILNEGDEVVILFSEVLFDKEAKISAHNPETISFIYEKKRIFEDWGYKVEILHAEMDYLDVFYHVISKGPNKGKTYGFVLPGGKCSLKRDCKLKPIHDWLENNRSDDIIQYIGIAIDEKERLESMKGQVVGTVSLLERYSLTESDARALCIRYDMLSPQYNLRGTKRDGCWVCPFSKFSESEVIRNMYPEAWRKFVSLEDTPNLAYYKWNPYTNETLHSREKVLSLGIKQPSIFDLIA